MPTVMGEFLKKTGSQNSFAVGDYCMLRSGYWVKVEAGGLWSGPYYTADGVTFTLVS